ncbi:hypothetical protein ACXET9_09420 [Brachybacterium sp. DNPG3]
MSSDRSPRPRPSAASIAASAALVVLLLFMAGTASGFPPALFGEGGFFRGGDGSSGSAGSSGSDGGSDAGADGASAPDPWTLTDLPGYDADPGPLVLAPLAEADGETVTAAFALEAGAAPIGGTIGLSFDATELASPLWDAEHSNLTLMLAELGSPALRFGGNGVDRRMWWTSSDEPAPAWAEVVVTPEDLERVAAVADDVDALVTIDLDLGHDDPARAADMAAHAREIFGERLLAVAIGNEPNGFFHENQMQLAVRDESWGTEAYQASLAEYATALEESSPGIPIAGPGAYDAAWMRAFLAADLPTTTALTMHWYPLWDCDGPDSSIANPTVEDLTSPALRERAREIIGMADGIASEADLPLWMEETGPTSCPGTNATSRTHAQALWTSDYTLTAAESGAERIAFHSTLQACRGGAPMSPICATGPLENPGLITEGRTSYLSLMQLGTLPDGQVLTPEVSGDGTVMVHGVYGDDGSFTAVIVDLRDPASTDAAIAVDLSAPTGLPDDAPESWTLAEGSRLAGDALDTEASTLTAPAALAGEYADAPLSSAQSLAVTSDPGTVTVLRFAAVG